MKLFNSAVAFALLGATLGAQCPTKYHDSATPTGGGNAFPWGCVGLRYQVIIPNTVLGTSPYAITDLLIAGNATTPSFTIDYTSIEIRMGRTKLATVGANWTANNPTPTVVYKGAINNVVLKMNAWNKLGLPRPYLYTGGIDNLCIEVITWGVKGYTAPKNFYFPASSGSIQRAFCYNWINNQTQAPLVGGMGGKIGIVCAGGGGGCNVTATRTFYGTGCGTAARGMQIGNTHPLPKLGQKGTLISKGGPKNSKGIYVIGAQKQSLDLTSIGMKGCSLYSQIDVTMPVTFDAGGNGTAATLNIPNNPALCGGRFYTTVIAIWPGLNTLGVATSNAIELVAGK